MNPLRPPLAFFQLVTSFLSSFLQTLRFQDYLPPLLTTHITRWPSRPFAFKFLYALRYSDNNWFIHLFRKAMKNVQSWEVRWYTFLHFLYCSVKVVQKIACVAIRRYWSSEHDAHKTTRLSWAYYIQTCKCYLVIEALIKSYQTIEPSPVYRIKEECILKYARCYQIVKNIEQFQKGILESDDICACSCDSSLFLFLSTFCEFVDAVDYIYI